MCMFPFKGQPWKSPQQCVCWDYLTPTAVRGELVTMVQSVESVDSLGVVWSGPKSFYSVSFVALGLKGKGGKGSSGIGCGGIGCGGSFSACLPGAHW